MILVNFFHLEGSRNIFFMARLDCVRGGRFRWLQSPRVQIGFPCTATSYIFLPERVRQRILYSNHFCDEAIMSGSVAVLIAREKSKHPIAPVTEFLGNCVDRRSFLKKNTGDWMQFDSTVVVCDDTHEEIIVGANESMVSTPFHNNKYDSVPSSNQVARYPITFELAIVAV